MARHRYLPPLLELVYRTVDQQALIPRRRAVALVVTTGVVWFTIVAVFVIQTFAVFSSRRPLRPDVFSVAEFVALIGFLYLVLWFAIVALPSRLEIDGSMFLRSAILRAESTFAPSAAHQPEPLPADISFDFDQALPEYPIQPHSIDRYILTLLFAISVFLMGFLIAAVLGVLGEIAFQGDSSLNGMIIWFLAFSFVAICRQWVIDGRNAFRWPVRSSFVIDDQGIHWREAGQISSVCLRGRILAHSVSTNNSSLRHTGRCIPICCLVPRRLSGGSSGSRRKRQNTLQAASWGD